MLPILMRYLGNFYQITAVMRLANLNMKAVRFTHPVLYFREARADRRLLLHGRVHWLQQLKFSFRCMAL